MRSQVPFALQSSSGSSIRDFLDDNSKPRENHHRLKARTPFVKTVGSPAMAAWVADFGGRDVAYKKQREKRTYYGEAATYRVLLGRPRRHAEKRFAGFKELALLGSGVIRYFQEFLSVGYYLTFSANPPPQGVLTLPNSVVMFGNGEQAKIGSITSQWEHFHEWKRLEEEEPGVVDMETELTRRVFGEYVSTYDFQRAVEDEATVPLYYDARGDKLTVAVGDLNERIAAKVASEAVTVQPDTAVDRPLYDISRIDFERLKQEFKRSAHQRTDVQQLKDTVKKKLQRMLERNQLSGRDNFYGCPIYLK